MIDKQLLSQSDSMLQYRYSHVNIDTGQQIAFIMFSIAIIGKTRYQKRIRISSVQVRNDQRGKGYAINLLKEAIGDAYQQFDMEYVVLYDGTDRFRKDHNIYRKIGLEYSSDNETDRTMIGKITDLKFN